ncbi:peptidase S8/S53 domain-containing protein, partial [Mycena pura]
MARVSVWATLVALLTVSSTSAAVSFVKHSLSEVPSGWTELQGEPVSPARGLNLRFGLTQSRYSELESALQHISNPIHPSYGKHLSKEQVHALSIPANETLAIVEAWLAVNNARSVQWSVSRDSVSAVLPVSTAEDMFSTRFSVFGHAESGTRVLRTLKYSLPAALMPHITFVHPITAFFDPLRHGAGRLALDEDIPVVAHRRGQLEKRPVALNQSDFPSCIAIIDPPCVREIYNIGNYTPQALHLGRNRIGVAGYLNIWARQDSLTLFLNDYIPESIGSNYTLDVVNITGMSLSSRSMDDEGNLDTQLAIQVAYPIPMTYYTTNSVPPYIPDQNQDGEVPGVNEPYLDFIDYILGLDDPPTVITTSYGDDEQTITRSYQRLTADRGITVMFSTGDQGLGVDDLPVATCIANTANNFTTFLPVFPASCPYVTSVGMTSGIIPATASLGSGAGFSYYYDRPLYQDAVVSAYLSGPANANETPLQSSMYNHRGRAYPDIVSAGDFQSILFVGIDERTLLGGGAFFDYFFNRWDIGGGTSAAVPTAAGIVALLNDWRLKHGRTTLGFLNPFLYGTGRKGLIDITDGNVVGCEQPGFNATKGCVP